MRKLWMLLLLCALPLTAADSRPSPVEDPHAARITRIVEAYAELGRFSGSVLVAQGDEVIHRSAWGIADRNHRVPVRPETRFGLASLSKQFTAAAVLLLAQEGKLDVNQPISAWLPEYPKPQGDQVTIHHVLTHSSGIPSYGRQGELENVVWDGNAKSLDDIIALSRELPLQFTPGSQYRYSNTGYTILARIVEKASGLSFAEFLHTRLFEPAGMTATLLPGGAEIIPDLATGYEGYAPDVAPAAYVHPTWTWGAGGVVSTVDDLFAWWKNLRGGKLLKPQSVAAFTGAYVARSAKDHFYGYGWFVEPFKNRRIINHGGSGSGIVCELTWLPDQDLFVVVLSNYLPELGSNIPWEISSRILCELLGETYDMPPMPRQVDGTALNAMAGEFRFAPDMLLRLSVKEGRLIARCEGERPWSLFTLREEIQFDKQQPLAVAAVAIARDYLSGDDAALRARASDKFSEFLTAERVGTFSRSIRDQYGDLIALSPYRIEKYPDLSVALVRLKLTKGDLYFRLGFNDKGQFHGAYIDQTTPAELELRTESPSACFADGFRWRTDDVRLEFANDGTLTLTGESVVRGVKVR